MTEPFLISKALDITPSALGKSASSTFKGLAVIGAIAGIFWMIYITAVKPHYNPLPTNETTQKAERMTNHYYNLEPKQTFFGCASFRFFQYDNEKKRVHSGETAKNTPDGKRGKAEDVKKP